MSFQPDTWSIVQRTVSNSRQLYVRYLFPTMMRTLLPLLVIVCSIGAFAHDHGPGDAKLLFHQNNGQWPDPVLYRAATPGGALFVERSAFTYVLSSGGERMGHGQVHGDPEPLRMHAFRVHFEGAKVSKHKGTARMTHYANYFLGNDPERWASSIPVYSGLELTEMYTGISMRIDGKDGMKYDWLVASGADPAQINMRYEGQGSISLEGGLLYVATSAGTVVEQRPVAWQVIHGSRRPVECHYALDGDRVRFVLPQGHDPKYPLVIDPVVVFSSYSGSFGDNFGFTATYDDSGHLYGGGMVRATGYPVTVGVLQANYGGGENDIAISKFSPDGSSLIWSTYIGGTANEVPHSMVVNSNDELFVLGTTNSANFPVSAGCYDNSFAGGTTPPFAGTSYGFTYTGGSDIVVVHLNNTATSLIGSTFVGGSGNDGLNQVAPTMRNYGDPFRGEIVLDQNERPMVATSTTSTDLFTSANATQSTLAGGVDAYIFRMDPGLTTMLWATYYGGSGTDAGFGIQISGADEVFVTGGTTSTDLPSAGNPFSASNSGGVDGFIARFHPSGSPLLSNTYLGTTGFDQSYFVQLDTSDDVFVVGQTTGPYPVTPGKYANPAATQFIHKFSTDLSTSLWSTRIGGAGNENISPTAFLVSTCGQIYFSGWAGTTNLAGGGGVPSSTTTGLPVTPDAYQSTTNGSDFYLMMLELEAEALGYATFFGGSSTEHVDGGTSRFDKNGIVYQAVCAGCQLLSYPTTPGAYSNTNNSTNCNLGVFKIDFEQAVQVAIQVDASDQTGCLGIPFTFNASGTASVWIWDLGDGTSGIEGAQIVHDYAEVGEYEVMLIGLDSNSCNFADTAFAIITVVEPPVVEALFEAEPASDCQGFSVELFNFSTNNMQYFWEFGDGTTSTLTNPVHGYAGPGEYEIVLTVTDPLCGNTADYSSTIVLDPPFIDPDLPSPVGLCDGGSVVLDAGSTYDTYLWSTGATGPSITVATPGTYWVAVTEGICSGSDTVVVVVQQAPPLAPDVLACPGDEPQLSPPYPVNSILWNTGSTEPTITVDASGTYWFTAEDQYGCLVRDTIEVTLVTYSASTAIVPNVFSPNGDGLNDTFMVEGLSLVDFSMEVYDRWGLIMYETNNPGRGWNGGLDNSAEKVPDGTYYYIVKFRDLCSQEPTTTRTGHVTLLR